jgi:preprotein translocase subunit SecA
VEQYYFGIRKQVLQFDDVMDRQRKSIYGLRQKILTGQLSTERLKEMSVHLVKNLLKPTTDERGLLAAELLDEVTKNLQQVVPQALPSGLLVAGKKASEVEVVLNQWLHDYLHARQNQLGSEIFSDLQRFVFLKVIDTKWIDHLHNMDVLREGIGLRAYGQQDPLVAYKMEGFKMFEALLSEIELEAFEFLFKAEVIRQDETELVPVTHGAIHMNDPSQALTASGVRPEAQQTSVSQPTETKALPMVNAEKVGRNDLCPCGSGKKYKKCHGVGG